jgi:hypothetical protein
MSSSSGPAVSWSTQVDQADWIAGRLLPPLEGVVTSVVPGGFDAYVRLLHPIGTRKDAESIRVRWSEVAAWSGQALDRDSQFHAIAVSRDGSEQPPPWQAAKPLPGSLEPDDAGALIDVLGRHTTTPGRCWFCIWEGYGWGGEASLAHRAELAGHLADPPIPAEVLAGPRVQLPWRDYFLYSGPIDAALAFVDSEAQTPNLFWPEDRAWCVATEIDLSSTYVGGSRRLADELVADRRIEALAAEPTDASSRVAPWVVELVESSVDTLIASKRLVIDTEVGFVYATLGRSRLRRRGTETFAIATARADGSMVNRQKAVRLGPDDDLRAALVRALTLAVVTLAGG